jgi:jasmonoyl-L-amino acid 12-hydroxylase
MLFILFIIALSLIVVVELKHCRSARARRMCVHRPWPLLGPLLTTVELVIAGANLKTYLLQLMQSRSCRVIELRALWGPPTVVVCDPKCVGHILANLERVYVKGSLFQRRARELLGAGIFNSNGALWKQQRKAASAMFRVALARRMMPMLGQVADRCVALLDDACERRVAVDLVDVFKQMAFDAAGRFVFGVDLRSLDAPSRFVDAVHRAQSGIIMRFNNPLIELLGPLARFVVDSERQLHSATRYLDTWCERLIRERLDGGAVAESDYACNFLDEYIATGSCHSVKELRDMVLSMAIASTDSVGALLSWVLYYLMRHRDVEARLRADIEADMARGDDDDQASAAGELFDRLRVMPYMSAVLNETLRLAPPVSWNQKTATRADTLPNGMSVEANSEVAYVPWIMARLDQVWSPRAEHFDPQRWLDSASNLRTLADIAEPYAAVGFQEPSIRSCLGKRLALTEVSLFLYRFLPRYEFVSQRPLHDVTYDASIALTPRGGLPCLINRRRRPSI